MRDGFSQIGSLIALYVGRHFTHFGKHLNDRIKSLKEDVRAVDVDHVLYIYKTSPGPLTLIRCYIYINISGFLLGTRGV